MSNEKELFDIIHKKCLWCCGNSIKLVYECPSSPEGKNVTPCKLWEYRMGSNPEAYEKLLEKMSKARESNNKNKK